MLFFLGGAGAQCAMLGVRVFWSSGPVSISPAWRSERLVATAARVFQNYLKRNIQTEMFNTERSVQLVQPDVELNSTVGQPPFNCLAICCLLFSLLVLKGIYHYCKCCSCVPGADSNGRLAKMFGDFLRLRPSARACIDPLITFINGPRPVEVVASARFSTCLF